MGKPVIGEDIIGVVVCAVVHDGMGNILLLRRGMNARDERGKWDICGGALEFGESVKAGLNRELHEELYATSLETKLLTVFDAHRTINSKKTHWVALLHSVLVDPKSVTLGEPDKFDEFGWFAIATLPKPLHSQFPKVFAAAKKAKIIK